MNNQQHSNEEPVVITRRRLIQGAGALGAYAALRNIAPAPVWAQGAALPARSSAASSAGVIDLTIDELLFPVNGRGGSAIALNGTVPGPLLRLREGQEAVIRVNNRLRESTSIHWHGVRKRWTEAVLRAARSRRARG